jgi:hypothetical protein
MFISKFSVEAWEGNQNRVLLEATQSWTEIEIAIRELDGQRKTLVTLEADGETHMAVGGRGDRYVVYVTFDNEAFYYLVDASRLGADERLTVGGQEGVYPAKLCVGRDAALKAARSFAEFGEMDASVTWEGDRVVEPV